MKRVYSIFGLLVVCLLIVSYFVKKQTNKEIIASQLKSQQKVLPQLGIVQSAKSQPLISREPSKAKAHAQSSKKILDKEKYQEQEILELVNSSQEKLEIGKAIYLFDFVAYNKKIPERNLIAKSMNKFIYSKDDNDKLLGIVISNNKVGIVTGEIVFQTQNYSKLIETLKTYNLEKVFLNSGASVYIFKTKDPDSFKQLLQDKNLKEFNPQVDIVFDFVQPV